MWLYDPSNYSHHRNCAHLVSRRITIYGLIPNRALRIVNEHPWIDRDDFVYFLQLNETPHNRPMPYPMVITAHQPSRGPSFREFREPPRTFPSSFSQSYHLASLLSSPPRNHHNLGHTGNLWMNEAQISGASRLTIERNTFAHKYTKPCQVSSTQPTQCTKLCKVS